MRPPRDTNGANAGMVLPRYSLYPVSGFAILRACANAMVRSASESNPMYDTKPDSASSVGQSMRSAASADPHPMLMDLTATSPPRQRTVVQKDLRHRSREGVNPLQGATCIQDTTRAVAA